MPAYSAPPLSLSRARAFPSPTGSDLPPLARASWLLIGRRAKGSPERRRPRSAVTSLGNPLLLYPPGQERWLAVHGAHPLAAAAPGKQAGTGSEQSAPVLAAPQTPGRQAGDQERPGGRTAPFYVREMMPSKTPRKAAPPNQAPQASAAVVECGVQLRKIGDKWDLQQKILNLIAKFFCPET